MKKTKIYIYLGIILFFILFIQIKFQPVSIESNNKSQSEQLMLQNFQLAIDIIKNYYVDEVEYKKVFEGGIIGMLHALDPHCNYIPAKEANEFTENYTGEFFGIGITYDIIKNYLTVISPVEGSPAYKAGLIPGDKIVKIDHETAFGISTKEVKEKLRGPKGTKVVLTIRRDGTEDFEVDIFRDKINISSVPYYYFLDDSTGYIKIATFSQKTFTELDEAIDSLKQKNLKRLVLDLRGNSGGLLDQAIKVCEKFLAHGEEIVTTRGKDQNYDQLYKAKITSDHLLIPMIVMIDNGSASASEIVAGALQDWDRSLIVGERSFGKGLVQRQFLLNNGASILLTISKYYTPSGRLIQRDYSNGYYHYYLDEDTEKEDSLKEKKAYYTKAKRTVYGGGGINPDNEINWSKISKLTHKIAFHADRPLFEFAKKICVREKEVCEDYQNFLTNFQLDEESFKDLKKLLRSKDIKFTDEEFNKSKSNLNRYVKQNIALHIWNPIKADQTFNYNNIDIIKTLKLFEESEKLNKIYTSRGK